MVGLKDNRLASIYRYCIVCCFCLLCGNWNLVAKANEAKDWRAVYPNVEEATAILVHNSALCAGTLISKRLILTAAHCVEQLRTVFVAWKSKIGSRERW